MAQFDVVDMNGKKVSTVELSDAVFGITPNEKAVHEAVVNFLANQRQAPRTPRSARKSAAAGRSWRQKGTGHARQLYPCSAVDPRRCCSGPQAPQLLLHHQQEGQASGSAQRLSDKAANGNMILVDKIAADEYKTKTVVAFLAAVGAGKKNLIVNDTLDAKFVKSAANIPGVQTAATGINTYDVVNADKLILSVDAAKKLEEYMRDEIRTGHRSRPRHHRELHGWHR